MAWCNQRHAIGSTIVDLRSIMPYGGHANTYIIKLSAKSQHSKIWFNPLWPNDKKCGTKPMMTYWKLDPNVTSIGWPDNEQEL